VPRSGIETYESRGMPRMAALCFAGTIDTMWIESASECSTSSPGRAPLPMNRIKIGFEPSREGT
jgi:hypothetical protein